MGSFMSEPGREFEILIYSQSPLFEAKSQDAKAFGRSTLNIEDSLGDNEAMSKRIFLLSVALRLGLVVISCRRMGTGASNLFQIIRVTIPEPRDFLF